MSIGKDYRRAPVARIRSVVDVGCSNFAQFLGNRGYAASTISIYTNSVERFAQWLVRQHGQDAELGEIVVREFLSAHRSSSSFQQTNSRAALRQLLIMSGASNGPSPFSTQSSGAIAAELAGFDEHLREVRGLAPATCSTRLRHVGDFLNTRFRNQTVLALRSIKPADVAEFVGRYTAGWRPASVKVVCCSLRSYFAYRAIQGGSTIALSAALPHVAQWRLAGLPQELSSEEIARLLNAFDRRSATGKRDYAITRCLLDLGLRRTEVARLCLEDVDWRTGIVRIHSKGKRIDALPLPAAMGQAIVSYLQGGRPKTRRREIFVRHRPPLDAPADVDIVRNAVRYAAARCGLADRIRGTHILRHTLAGRLVRQGTRFKEIADLLRHRSIDTTTIYAKVDLPALNDVALPWPGRRI